jgi:hypothetical protein
MAWVKKDQDSLADRRTTWPHIAEEMAKLRLDYPSDPEFGAALVLHGIEYNKNDRAAFIWMGSLDPAVLAAALAQSESESPKWFRLEAEAYCKSLSPRGDSSSVDRLPAESSETAPVTAESEHVAIQEDTKTEIPAANRADCQWNANAKLYPLGEDGRLLHAIIGGGNARGAVNLLMPKQKKFLRFVVDQIKAGRLTPPPFNASIFHAQRLVPALDRTFASEMAFAHRVEAKIDAKACAIFMEHFDLVLQAAEKGWTYVDFQRACKGMIVRPTATSAEEVWAQPAPSMESTQTLPAMITTLDGTILRPEPIYVCGQRLFPAETRGKLSYVEAYTHTHDCREWVKQMISTSSVQEIGMHLAHRGLIIQRFYDKDLGGFLSALGTAIRANGESISPELWFKLEPFKNSTTR